MSGESHPIATSHDQGENATNIHKEITYLFKNHAIPSNRLIAAVGLMVKSQRIHWSALSASSRLDTHGDKKMCGCVPRYFFRAVHSTGTVRRAQNRPNHTDVGTLTSTHVRSVSPLYIGAKRSMVKKIHRTQNASISSWDEDYFLSSRNPHSDDVSQISLKGERSSSFLE